MTELYETFAFGKTKKGEPFSQIKVRRNLPGDNQVQFDIRFCGICHTDVHYAADEMGVTKFPVVPGHELAGVVTQVGAKVADISIGDNVGVGGLVDSCLDCINCGKGDEQYCDREATYTYNGVIKHGRIATDTGVTYGGYSGSMTVDRRFLIKIPKNYPLEAAGPIFCAGITMYSPLNHWGALKGNLRVGVVGIGGLGQMGIRLASAMGNKVTAISTSPSKEKEALSLGATNFVVSSDEKKMAAAAKSLDLILNTVSANHQVASYLPLLANSGTIVQLGLVLQPHQVSQIALFSRRLSIAGSLIGGIRETQACIDFCAAQNIVPTYEIIKADRLDEVHRSLASHNDTVKRFVLDCQNSFQG